MSIETQLDYSLPIPILASSYPAAKEGTRIEVPYDLGYPVEGDYEIEYRIMVANTNSIILEDNIEPDYDDLLFNIDFNDATIDTGIYYKMQCRVKQEVEDNIAYSLWSNLMALKFIGEPKLTLSANKKSSLASQSESSSYLFGLTPTFTGTYSAYDNEILASYKFLLTSALNEEESFYDSDWILYDQSNMRNSKKTIVSTVDFSFPFELDQNEIYKIEFYTKSINGYEASKVGYFNVTDLSVNIIPDEEIIIYGQVDSENGLIQIDIEPKTFQNKRYVLVRRSEKDNFSKIEDLTSFIFQEGKIKFSYKDFLIESGIQYQYGIQQEDANGNRIKYKWLEEYLECNYEYVFLYSQGKQLKLKYNNTLNTFKHTRQESKQDTLGSKYPIISRNADTCYAEFPINALITFNMDENCLFFNELDAGYYYGEELVVPARKYRSIIPESKDQQYLMLNSFGINLDNDSVFIEKAFREKVEDFLTNRQPKVFKSSTEGIFLVDLMNVSFSPNQQLGRMISSISATAYEIDAFTLNNLLKYGVIPNFDTINEEDFVYISEYQQCMFINDNANNSKSLSELIEEKLSNEKQNHENYEHSEFEYIEIYNGSSQNAIIKIKKDSAYGDGIYIKPHSKYVIDMTIKDIKISGGDTINPVEILCKHKLKLNETTQKLSDSHILYRIAQINPNISYGEGDNLYTTIEKTIVNYVNGNRDRVKNSWGQITAEYNPTEGYLDENKTLYLIGLEWIRIEAPEGTKFEINGNTIEMNPTGIYNYKMESQYITSLKIADSNLLDKILIDYKYILAHFRYSSTGG